MLMVSFGLWSTASILTPGSASSNSAIILARVAVGVAQGFLIPSVHTVLSQVHAGHLLSSIIMRLCLDHCCFCDMLETNKSAETLHEPPTVPA